MPQLDDPNFHRAVILMLEHTSSGAMGLVINRTGPITLKDVADGQQLAIAAGRSTEPVYMGGPVEPQRGFVLHDDPRVSEKAEVMPGLYLSMTLDALGGLLARDDAKLRFCLGCSGWGPNQLETEIADGAWIYTEAAAEAALSGDPSTLWDDTVRSMGFDPRMLLPSKGVN